MDYVFTLFLAFEEVTKTHGLRKIPPFDFCHITQQMLPYVVKYFPSPVQTIYAGTKRIFVPIWSTSFGSKLQELLHAFLIRRAYATFVHPTSIHLNNNSVILSYLMHENLTFSLKVWPYPIQEYIFL